MKGTKILIGLACLAGVSLAHAQSTAFTYQGRLNDGAGAATGSYDLTFALFDAANSGVQQGLILTNSSTAVTNGLFTVSLDFGNQFPGANRWLEIGVRTNGNGLFATLSPRQPLASTPYAIQAARANAVAAANITGSMALAQLPAGVVTNGGAISGTFTGNGAGITGLNPGNLGAGTAGINISGNAATATSAISAGTAGTAGSFSGLLGGDVTGTQGATQVGSVGGETAANVASGARAANGAQVGNGVGTLVKRDGSGNFSAGTITGSLTGNASSATTAGTAGLATNVVNGIGITNAFITNSVFAGNGAGLTNLSVNAAQVTGTIGLGQLPAGLVTNGGAISGTFTGNGAGITGLNPGNLGAGTAGINISGNAATATSATSAGTAGTATTALTAGLATNLVDGIGITNAFITNSVFAGNGAGLTNLSVSAAQLTGTIGLGQLPVGVVTNGASGVNFSGTFTGNGSGMTNVDLLNVADHGAISWKTNYAGFTLTSSLGVGDAPLSVTASDVNGDGKLDLISANYSSHTLTILTNNGIGGFAVSSSPGVGLNPHSVTAADVNGDGEPDLISANYSDSTLTVLTNDGGGGFLVSSSPGVGLGPWSVTVADANGDGRVDLISANLDANTLTVLTNNGSGGFEVSSSPSVVSTPISVTAADVDGDGKVDLIIANYFANTLTVLTNNRSGGFAVSSSPGVGTYPVSVTTADVNGDGRVDLISANYGDSTLTVLTNNGSGGFAVSSTPQTGIYSFPMSVTAADVNGDGKADLISANVSASSAYVLTILTNNGSGGFAVGASPDLGTIPSSVTAADLNGDGHVDLITANPDNDTLALFLSPPATYGGIFSGDGGGLTGLAGSNITGVLGTAQIPNLDANKISSGTFAPAQIPNLDASKITGVLGTAQIPSLDAAKIVSGTFGAAQIPNLDAAKITGILGVAQIPNLDAPKISSGTLGDARLSPNVALLSANQTFTGANVISNSAGQPDLLFRGNSILRLLAFNNGNYIQSGATNAAGSTNDLYFTGLSGSPVQMVVKASGNVGIGNGTPAARLDVSGSGWFRDDSGGLPASAGSGIRIYNQPGGAGGHIFAYNYLSSSPQNLLLQQPGGNVGIGNPNPNNKLMVVNARCDGSSWINASDRNLKQDFAVVDPQAVLAKVVALPVQSWSYKAQPEQKHLGPVAQDFHAAFGLGQDDTSIATVDEGGVALAAIQGLNEKLERKSQALEAENAELKARLERLERLLTRLPDGGAR